MYQFIENLPENWQQFSNTELESLGQVWQERKAALVQSDALEQFTRRLRREWAIETGIIERLYSWDQSRDFSSSELLLNWMRLQNRSVSARRAIGVLILQLSRQNLFWHLGITLCVKGNAVRKLNGPRY